MPPAARGAPLLPGPVFAAPYHLAGEVEGAPYSGYGRDGNPTWERLEAAIGELEGGETVAFPSGMAATAAVLDRLGTGDVLVACRDGYPGIRALARERLQRRGVEVRLVPTDTEAMLAALVGATVVWAETPSNPCLDVVDVAAVAESARARGALFVVDNTVATPLGQRPLDLGAHVSMLSGTKALTGHSDVLLGVLTTRDRALAEALRGDRSHTGAIAGPFEAWLAHRSLATLDLRLARQCENAQALARMLRERSDVLEVRYPGLEDDPSHAIAARQMTRFGPLVGFTLASAARAQAFLAACELVSEATSFGGVHTTAERRARWGTDDIPEGYIRFSAGIEDTSDLLADVELALGASLAA